MYTYRSDELDRRADTRELLGWTEIQSQVQAYVGERLQGVQEESSALAQAQAVSTCCAPAPHERAQRVSCPLLPLYAACVPTH